MANVIKRDGSPYWFATFDVTMPDGKVRRLKKSTKRTKRSEAITEALRLEEAAKKKHTADQGAASKAYAILSEAADAAARGELSEARARELLAKLTEISTGQPLRFYTVRSWRAEWLAMKAGGAKPATLRRYGDHTEVFTDWLGDKADARLEAVTKADVRAFRDALRDGWDPNPRLDDEGKPILTPRTAKTVNHYAADVAGMFRAAMRDGLMLANPCAALGKLPELDSTEREVFTVAEVGQLVQAAGNTEWQDGVFAATDRLRPQRSVDWQGMILAGFYAGARLGDCSRLTWGNVDLDRKILEFVPSKTERKRKRLQVPLHPRLVTWLKEQGQGKDDTPLFPALAGARPGGAGGLSGQFVRIMELAGIDRRAARQTGQGRRAQYTRSFHSLRHSLTSTLANLDVSEEIRRRIVGHDSAEVHAKYTHTERETLARAMEKMPSV